jgi:hypothetical protein
MISKMQKAPAITGAKYILSAVHRATGILRVMDEKL